MSLLQVRIEGGIPVLDVSNANLVIQISGKVLDYSQETRSFLYRDGVRVWGTFALGEMYVLQIDFADKSATTKAALPVLFEADYSRILKARRSRSGKLEMEVAGLRKQLNREAKRLLYIWHLEHPPLRR